MTHSPDICFFTSTMGDGGAQRTIANLATGFSELGYDVDLLLLHRSGPYLRDLPHQVRAVELSADRARGAPIPLVRYIRTASPDVFLSTMEYLNIISVAANLFSNANTDIAIRQATVQRPYQMCRNKKKIQRLIAKSIYPQADHHIALSKDAKMDMQKRYNLGSHQIDVIHNPVRVSHIRTLAKGHAEFEQTDPDSDLIISVGRLAPVKDIQTTLRACKRLSKYRDIELILLGKGELRPELENLATDLGINDIVHFLGFVDNPYPYIMMADSLVLSSRREGFGNVLVEAMACKTPVVSTTCPGGPTEILSNGKYGPLVPVGDSEQLATAIESTLVSPVDPDKLLRRAQDFDYINITRQYESVLL